MLTSEVLAFEGATPVFQKLSFRLLKAKLLHLVFLAFARQNLSFCKPFSFPPGFQCFTNDEYAATNNENIEGCRVEVG